MKNIYGRDHIGIDPQVLGNRIKLISHLLTQVQKSAIDQNVAAEVIKRIRARMDSVPGIIQGKFADQDEEIKPGCGSSRTTAARNHKNLLKIIGNSKTRSGTRKKRHIQLSPEKDFTDPDFAAIAENFEISTRDAREIIQIFQGCFDGQGRFLKAAFEKSIPRFARHEKKVFEILWEFLKDTPQRRNRLPFLNSLQLLVAETKKPIQVIKALLADFTRNPEGVYYPDRNAVMLLNQLLRAYNKEAVMDIEITPEEVLRVKGGLKESVVNYVAWKVDGGQKTFPNKIGAIRKRLVEAMDQELSEAQLLPIRFLLALEREVHIFLALVGGRTAVEVIRSALSVYGNPASQIYHLRESSGQREPLLLHLAALIRGFGRLGRQSDMSLLDEIKMRQGQFAVWRPDMRYQALVRRVMGLIDATITAISSRN